MWSFATLWVHPLSDISKSTHKEKIGARSYCDLSIYIYISIYIFIYIYIYIFIYTYLQLLTSN